MHVFTESDGLTFRQTRLVQPAEQLAPQFKPAAILNLSELFAT